MNERLCIYAQKKGITFYWSFLFQLCVKGLGYIRRPLLSVPLWHSKLPFCCTTRCGRFHEESGTNTFLLCLSSPNLGKAKPYRSVCTRQPQHSDKTESKSYSWFQP